MSWFMFLTLIFILPLSHSAGEIACEKRITNEFRGANIFAILSDDMSVSAGSDKVSHSVSKLNTPPSPPLKIIKMKIIFIKKAPNYLIKKTNIHPFSLGGKSGALRIFSYGKDAILVILSVCETVKLNLLVRTSTQSFSHPERCSSVFTNNVKKWYRGKVTSNAISISKNDILTGNILRKQIKKIVNERAGSHKVSE